MNHYSHNTQNPNSAQNENPSPQPQSQQTQQLQSMNATHSHHITPTGFSTYHCNQPHTLYNHSMNITTPNPLIGHPYHLHPHSIHHNYNNHHLYSFKFEHILDALFLPSNNNDDENKNKKKNKPASNRLFLGNHIQSMAIKSHVKYIYIMLYIM